MFTLTAAVLAVRSPGGTIDAADAFYDALAAVDHDADASDRGHLILNAVMDEIEGAQRPIAYDSVLLLSEALAVRTLEGSNYADLASQWVPLGAADHGDPLQRKARRLRPRSRRHAPAGNHV